MDATSGEDNVNRRSSCASNQPHAKSLRQWSSVSLPHQQADPAQGGSAGLEIIKQEPLASPGRSRGHRISTPSASTGLDLSMPSDGADIGAPNNNMAPRPSLNSRGLDLSTLSTLMLPPPSPVRASDRRGSSRSSAAGRRHRISAQTVDEPGKEDRGGNGAGGGGTGGGGVDGSTGTGDAGARGTAGNDPGDVRARIRPGNNNQEDNVDYAGLSLEPNFLADVLPLSELGLRRMLRDRQHRIDLMINSTDIMHEQIFLSLVHMLGVQPRPQTQLGQRQARQQGPARQQQQQPGQTQARKRHGRGQAQQEKQSQTHQGGGAEQEQPTAGHAHQVRRSPVKDAAALPSGVQRESD